VQLQRLGYPGTLGAPWIGLYRRRPRAHSAAGRASLSEKIVWLPHSYQANDDKRVTATTQERRSYGLPDSFNGVFKLTPELFDCWLRLLRAVDRSVFWLLQPEDGGGSA